MLARDDVVVGRLDGYSLPAAAVEVGQLTVQRARELKEVSARDVGSLQRHILLFGYLHPLPVHLHLVTYLIVAQVLAVEHHVGKLGRRHKGLPHLLAYEGCHGIAQQRLVAMVGQQSPALGFGMLLAQEPFLAIELQPIGLLGHPPCAVAPAPYP